MPVTKILAGVMLVLTLGLGVLLAQVVGERNVAETDLKSTKETLKSTKDDLKDAKADATLCVSTLAQQNLYIAQMQQDALASGYDAIARADEVLSALPKQIADDRKDVSLVATNKWMVELFK